MFVHINYLKTKTILLMTMLMAGAAGPSMANDAAEKTVPLRVTITDVRAGDVPFYISVQTRDTYQSMKGEGRILKATEDGLLNQTIMLEQGGNYAVSVWHDLDNDGRFSMTETFQILDGWGASGTPPKMAAPTFDDVKVSVPDSGGSTTIAMVYPQS